MTEPMCDYDDAFEVDGIHAFALDRALELMRDWEEAVGGKQTLEAAHVYATIALVAGNRLAALGGIPELEPSLCADCATDIAPRPPQANWEYFMVTDEVWSAAGMPEDGYLCLDCLETRLGRQLNGADFTDVPINEPREEVDSARMAELKRAAAALRAVSA